MIMSNKYMQIVLNEAKKVEIDIPICALIVKDDEIVVEKKALLPNSMCISIALQPVTWNLNLLNI